MSGTPFQQWTYVPEGRYADVRTYPSDGGCRRRTPAPNPSKLAQEPPRFLLPITQNNEPTMLQSASYPRLPLQGFPIQIRALDDRGDPKYRPLPATTGSLAQYSIQRPSTSRNVENASSSGSYYDVPSCSRGSVGSVGRINDVDSQYSGSTTTFPSPVHSDRSPIYPAIAPLSGYQQQLLIHQRHATASMPSGFENLLHHHPPSPSPPPRCASSSSRYRLFIRQQPIAARACGAGDRDRRPVDPPPIIQLLLTDFNPNSEKDRSILQDPRFTVGCLLYPIQHHSYLPGSGAGANPSNTNTDTNASPHHETMNLYSHLGINPEDNHAPGQSTPLLSGKSFVSPFYVDEEPDPNTAPTHPSSTDSTHEASPRTLAHNLRNRPLPKPPACFFIFSDLSVRTAGLYRLQFRLMNWGSIEDMGQSMPILAEVWSEPFRVYAAKDFPGMRDSSLLTLRLKELGFVELKTRGQGMGKGRRVGVGGSKGGTRAQVEQTS